MPAAHDAGALLIRGVVLEASALRRLVSMAPSEPLAILRQVVSPVVSGPDRVLDGNPLSDRLQHRDLFFELDGTLGSGQEPAREFIHAVGQSIFGQHGSRMLLFSSG